MNCCQTVLIFIKDNNNDYNDGFSEDYFKEALKNYLVERNLFETEEPVSKEQMKKIFWK